jgi:hypothetical protein
MHMNKSRLVLGVGFLIIAVCFSYAQITHGQSAATSTPFIACTSNTQCAVGSNNPTSNDIDTTVCYYPGTTASFCGTPAPAGETAPACAFPTTGVNQAGNAAIQIACQEKFGSQYAACQANNKGLDCAYTLNGASAQSLAFNCGMPGAGMGGPGYCLPGDSPAGCIATMTEAQLAAAVGASCSSLTPSTSTGSTSGTTSTGTTSTGTTSSATNPITGIQGFNPATGAYTNGTAVEGTYIILYGTFSPTGNTVSIDAQLVTPSYQSSNQINVPITGIVPGSHFVGVTTQLGTNVTPEIGSVNFTVTATAGATASTTQAETSFTGGLNAELAILTQELDTLRNTPPPSGVAETQTYGNATTTAANISFPVTILVTVSALHVRPSPNTSSPLSGSGTLHAGDTFTATNEVVGQSVDGNDLWWVSSLGNYVWSGGTDVEGSAATSTTVSTPGVSFAPVLTSADGYNPNLNEQPVTDVFHSGDTVLVLNGAFASSGNTVNINGQAIPSTDITHEEIAQINVSMGSIINTTTPLPFNVSVTDANGTSSVINITIGGGGGSAPGNASLQASCFCSGGEASCTGWNGGSVAVPSGFSCGSNNDEDPLGGGAGSGLGCFSDGAGGEICTANSN